MSALYASLTIRCTLRTVSSISVAPFIVKLLVVCVVTSGALHRLRARRLEWCPLFERNQIRKLLLEIFSACFSCQTCCSCSANRLRRVLRALSVWSRLLTKLRGFPSGPVAHCVTSRTARNTWSCRASSRPLSLARRRSYLLRLCNSKHPATCASVFFRSSIPCLKLSIIAVLSLRPNAHSNVATSASRLHLCIHLLH